MISDARRAGGHLWMTAAGIAEVVAIVLLVMACPRMDAAAEESRPGVVLPIVVSSTSRVTREEARVVGLAVSVALEAAGLSVTETQIIRESPPSSWELDSHALGDAHDFVLFTRLTKEMETISFTMWWYESGSTAPVHSTSASVPLDYRTDRAIAAAVDRILTATGARGRVFAVPATDTPERNVDSDPDEREPSPPPTGNIMFAIGMESLVATGRASDYFKFGLGTSTSTLFRTGKDPDNAVGVGLRTAAFVFEATGRNAASRSLLLPVGLEVGMRRGGESGIAAIIDGSAGPAILSIDPNGLGRLWKVIPYLSVGIGLEAMAGPRVGLVLSASYAVYFEGNYPLTAFTPALRLDIRSAGEEKR